MIKGFIIAGEASAELYASELISKLKNRFDSIRVAGIGGDRLKAEGVEILEHYSQISVVGVKEVLGHLKKIRYAINAAVNWIKKNQPDFVIFIDFPDFNFRVIKKIKKWYRGKIIYFVSPQVWAWRAERKNFIKKNVDKMIVILPFEKQIYDEIGFNVEYLGHPLVDLVKPSLDIQDFKNKYNIKNGARILSVFPGSREKEICNHTLTLQKVIEKIKLAYSDVEVCVVAANDSIHNLLAEKFNSSRVRIVSKDDNYNAIYSSQIVIAKSGTTTLETAIAKKPAVVFYKVEGLSYVIGKLFIKVPFISLPNLILSENVYPEFVQANFNMDNIFNATKRFIEDTDLYLHTVERLACLKELLGEEGYFDRAAEKINEWING